MKFALVQKIATFALAGIAAAPLIASGEIGLLFQGAFAVFYMVGWVLRSRVMRSPRFRRGVTFLVVLVFAIQLTRLFTGEPMAKLGMELAMVLLLAKLCSRGFSSDYYQIIVLSFLHIIAATVAIDSLIYGISFVLFVALSAPVLALSYLRGEMERRFGKDEKEDRSEMLKRLLRSKRIVSPRFLIGSSLLSLPILLVTGFMFVVFPRVGFGFFGKISKRDSTIGFGNEVRLSDLDYLLQDNTVLMRLEPTGSWTSRPKQIPIRLRGGIFDLYDDNVWKKSNGRSWKKLNAQGDNYLFDSRFFIASEMRGFEVLLESMVPPLLFVPEGTGQITTYPVSVGGVPQTRRLERNTLGMIRYDDKANVGIRYKVYLTHVQPLGGPPDARRDYLQLPPDSGRLAELARQFGGKGSVRQQVIEIIEQIRKNYRYSLTVEDAEKNALEETPLDRFLFSRKTGICSHFATALTLMLRVIGVPARMVTGFYGAEWNEVGNYYAVRKRSAHSWTEAYLDGQWVTLDATPAGFGGPTVDAPSRLAMVVDMLRMRWHKYVVSYDIASQFELAVTIRKYLVKYRTSRPESRSTSGIVGLVLAMMVLFGVGRFLYRFRKRRKWNLSKRFRERPQKRQIKEVTKLYQRLERRLARLGYPRPHFRTPARHVEMLRSSASNLAGIAGKVTERYNEVRFGGRDFNAGELKQLTLLVRRL
jgi:transglutaminase-like putative cysteine protease